MPSDLGFALTAFVTLFVTLGPVETAAIFLALTPDADRSQRAQLALRAVAIAATLLVVFGLTGAPVLQWMHVSMPAFRFAAGVMLFLQAVSLVFASPTQMSSLSAAEKREALRTRDIAVFPLAFPLIAGPGSLTAMVVLLGEASVVRVSIVMIALALCLVLTYLAFRGADVLGRLLGVTGADVVGRISGILLGALAAQFMFDGLREGLFNRP